MNEPMLTASGANLLHLKGQAGVWRVASMLALRGFNPHFPGVDHGYDLMVQGSIRLQVKCAHLQFLHNAQGSYDFTLKRRNSKTRKGEPQVLSAKSEFVILWGIDQDRFWIVPSCLLDNVPFITVGPDTNWKDIDMEEMRAMRERGDTLEEIGRYFGVSQTFVHKRLRGRHLIPQKATCEKVRRCEGRWDLIESYLRILTEAERPSALSLIEEFTR